MPMRVTTVFRRLLGVTKMYVEQVFFTVTGDLAVHRLGGRERQDRSPRPVHSHRGLPRSSRAAVQAAQHESSRLRPHSSQLEPHKQLPHRNGRECTKLPRSPGALNTDSMPSLAPNRSSPPGKLQLVGRALRDAEAQYLVRYGHVLPDPYYPARTNVRSPHLQAQVRIATHHGSAQCRPRVASRRRPEHDVGDLVSGWPARARRREQRWRHRAGTRRAKRSPNSRAHAPLFHCSRSTLRLSERPSRLSAWQK